MRYSRQEVFNKIGKTGQKILGNSTITIVGLGAIGTVAAEQLTRAGIGKLILIDRDYVELSNLQRQVLFTEEDIDKPKAMQAKDSLAKINSEVAIKAYFDDLNFKNINKLVKGLILDCTDNLETRFLINEYAIKNKLAWIHAAAIEDHGNVLVITQGGPCFRCITEEASNLETCDTAGVINTIPSVIASIQVTQAIKILLKQGFEKNLIRFNIWKNKLVKIPLKKNPNCPACNKNFEYLNGRKANDIVKFCGGNDYLVRGKGIDIKQMKKRLQRLGKVKDVNGCLYFKNMVIFRDGRVLISARNESEVKATYSKYMGN